MYESHQNIKVIEHILEKRKEAEIVFVDNKNSVTIYNENYIESQKIKESGGINLINEDIS